MPKYFRIAIITLAIVLFSLSWYNHFHNPFHFDDAHTIVTNPAIQSLSNIPKFFIDVNGTMFSTLSTNQTWRPILSTTLAIDYWIGKLNPVVYQVDSFLWFVGLLGSLWYLLYIRVFHGSWFWCTVTTTLFGIHPITAETVNYVIQRGEIITSLCFVLALIVTYKWKKGANGPEITYIVAVMLIGALAKPTILILPLFLLVRGRLFFEGFSKSPKLRLVLRTTKWSCGIGILLFLMNSKFSGGSMDPKGYIITQPSIWARALTQFIWPTQLSVDTDMPYSITGSPEFILGVLVVIGLVGFAVYRFRQYDVAISFGAWWFIITMLPTSLMPIAEVTNDHRLFLPLIGLCIMLVGIVKYTVGELAYQSENLWFAAWTTIAIIVFGTFPSMLHTRNTVWSSDTLLWQDTIAKSPHNGRALMNYGLIFMASGNYTQAKYYFDLAEKETPNYWCLMVNQAILHDAMGVTGGVNVQKEGDRYWRRALSLSPLSKEWYSVKRGNVILPQ